MNKRKIIIKPVLELRKAEKAVDEWVSHSSIANVEESENHKTKTMIPLQTDYRFTVVIPEFLHRRIKKHCAVHGISIKEKLTEIFEKEFPET